MSVTVGDILRVVQIIAWLDGDVMMNVFNAVIGGTGGPYDDDDIVDDADAWLDDVGAAFIGQVSDECNGSELRVYIYDAIDDDWDEVGSANWVYDPAAATEQLPRGVALLINAKTTDPDVNGKKYIGGMTEAAVTDGLWTAGEIGRAATYAASWLTPFAGDVSGASWVPGVWSPTETNFFAASGDFIIPTIPAYQRRRKRGVGI